MRQLLIRRQSRSARIAQSVAVFAIILALLGMVGFRYRFIEPLTFLFAIAAAASFAVIAVLFAAFGISSLWREGAEGGTACMRAIGLAVLILGPLAYAGFTASQLPTLNDVSTSRDDPIAFPLGSRLDVGPQFSPPMSEEEAALAQSAAYPDVLTRIYNISPRRLERALQQTAHTLGWEPLSRTGALSAEGGQRFAYLAQTWILRFEDDVVVRFKPQDGGIAVDIRSAGRLGDHDFGGHARRIRTFYDTFERALKALPQDNL